MLRVPARAGVIAFTAATVLAAFGWIGFWEWLSKRRTWPELRVAFVVIALLSIEFFSAPIPLFSEVSGERIPQVYSFLRDYPDSGGVLEIPAQGKEADGTEFWERIYTYFSAYHMKPIVIGYSAYYPPNFHELIAASLELPSDKALDLFEAIGVRSIVLHTTRLTGVQIQAWNSALNSGERLRQIAEFPDGGRLIALEPSLRLSRNLNDLDWQLESGPAAADA
jgi:hypothetical protein